MSEQAQRDPRTRRRIVITAVILALIAVAFFVGSFYYFTATP
jgi:predicted secreted protein